MKKFKYIFCYFLLVIPLFSHAQSIENFIDLATSKNPNLKAKYLEFEAALQKVKQVNSLSDPKLTFGYFISPIETRVGAQQARISLSQMFPWFGTLKAKGSVATLLAEAKYQDFLQAKFELIYELKSAYYPIYEIHKRITIQEENLKLLGVYKQLATSNFSIGKSAMTDVLRTELKIEDAHIEIQLLKDQLPSLKSKLNTILNKPIDTEVTIMDSLFIDSIKESYRKDSLFLANPLLESLRLKMESASKMEELAKLQRMPQFGLGVDYAFISERTDISIPNNGKDAIMPMVSITLPIFGSKYKALTNEAQLNQDALNYRIKALENSLLANYELVKYQILKSRQLYDLYNSKIITSKQILELLITAYSNDGENFEEVLLIQQTILKYKIALLTVLTSYHLGMAKLDLLTNKNE